MHPQGSCKICQMSVNIQQQTQYEHLDEVSSDWVNRIKLMWGAWGKSDAVMTLLYDYFENCGNQYDSALKAMVNSGDFYSAKKSSLSYFVIENLEQWKMIYPHKLPTLTVNMKHDAFNLVMKQKNFILIKKTSEVFEMKADKFHFVSSIEFLVGMKMYKEACQVSVMLELYDQFGIEEFIVPLIFQDKFNVVQELLNESPTKQVEIAQYLDNLLGKKYVKSEVEKLVKELDIFDPKGEKMCGKALMKLLARIIKLYNIPEDTCPNSKKKRGSGALQYLLRKRFIDKDIGEESWSEMVEDIVGSDTNLHLELVIGVSTFGKQTEAAKWAGKYNVPYDMWPYKLHIWRKQQMGMSSDNPAPIDQQEESWDIAEVTQNREYHRISESKIRLIDSMESFDNFLESDFKNVDICGIDCEWKPSMGLKKCELALIQIATFEAAYIIDIVTLLPIAQEEMWEVLLSKIFLNDNILKLGFGFDCDFAVLTDTIPFFKNIRPLGRGYLDLVTLWRALVNDCKFVFPFSVDNSSSSNSESLSRLVELTLGKYLDKSDQFSNWEKRPLRKSQISYAAADAYCLLEVYEVLRVQTEKQGIPFFDLISNITRDDEDNQKKIRKKK